MKRIIDSHCHIYPKNIAYKAVHSVDSFYDGLPYDHSDGTVDTLILNGAKMGITHFIVHSVATKPEQVSHINQFIAGEVAAHPKELTGLGTMHLDSDDLARDLDELEALGLKGVKIHPDIQKFQADDPKAMRLYEMCEGRIPVYIHAGDYRYDYSNPPRIAHILEAFPKLSLWAAHLGGWSMWDEAIKLLPKYPNLVVDTSSSIYYMEPEKTKQIIQAYGTSRVMFGTDYPLWPAKIDIEYLQKLGFREEEYEQIFWKNTADFFGLTFDDDKEEWES